MERKRKKMRMSWEREGRKSVHEGMRELKEGWKNGRKEKESRKLVWS